VFAQLIPVSVLHINMRPIGGAWKVASRLASLQNAAGIETLLVSIVNEKFSSRSLELKISNKLDYEVQQTQKTITTTSFFSGITLAKSVEDQLKMAHSDSIIHLHWLPGLFSNSFLRLMENRNVIWTLHDMRLMTGYCHHSGGCDQFQKSCHSCPQAPRILHDAIESKFKKTALQLASISNLKLVSPSDWLAKIARDSSATRNIPISVIRNPIPENVFNMNLRSFGLKENQGNINVCIYGEDVPSKGGKRAINLLIEIQKFSQLQFNVFVLGAKHKIPDKIIQIEVPHIENDREFAKFLSAMDVLIHFSDAENSPSLIREAQACGVFVIAEDVGGTKELLFDPDKFTFEIHDYKQLAALFQQILERNITDASSHKQIAGVPLEFRSQQILEEYLKLYQT
jgi:glycosyltransferase involved in cell wall biosynthesis